MERDDEVGEDYSTDSGEAPVGPRRSTFTPPTGQQPAVPERPAVPEPLVSPTDDDALADALAADLGRIASGPITIITASTPVPPGPAMARPVPEAPASEAPAPAPAPPAWSGFPPPDPTTQAIPIVDGPPVRKSLPDDEFSRWVAEVSQKPGGTLDVIEQLQTQMKLREEEARELRAWEDRMRSLGTPDVPQPVGPEPITPEPVAAEPQPEPQRPPLPAWDVPAPSANWSPASWDEEAPTTSTNEPEPPPLSEPTRAPFDWNAETSPSPLIPPATAAAAPSIPVAEDDDVVVPTIEPDTATAFSEIPELTVEPLPDTPPPLIEPTGFGGPPVLPSQTKNQKAFSFDAALAAPAPAGDDDDDEGGDEDPEPGARAFDWTMPGPPPRVAPATPMGFDGLLAEEPQGHSDADPETGQAEELFIEPMPVAAGEPIPTDTGSISIVDQAYDEDIEDDVDEMDRASDTAGNAAMISPPSGPISTVRIPVGEQVLFDDEPVPLPVFSIEESDVEPTPVDHRVGRAARLFWLWFAANSSILSIGLGAAVFAVGMSLRQSIVAILAGIALSFIPLGLTTLAGKRSCQPTMIVSRASFGVIGNVIPALVALVTRLFWGAVLLWLLASSIAVVLVGAGLNGALGERQILLISLAAAFLIAVLVAFAGYPMIARIQLFLSVISGILIVGLIAMTYQYIDIPQALTNPDGPWLLTITGAVLVFSFVGLVWANSGADLARYQRTDSSGASSMLWATFGTAVPSFLLIGYGALLAASDKGIASGFLLSPLDTLAIMLPSWYPVPLIAATALSLLSGIIISLYSGGFALQSMGVRVKRQWSIVIVGVLLGGLALLLGFGVTGGLTELFRDAATTLAVPTAAWAGIFAAEMMIRNRRFEGQSLVRRGGVYADIRWVNLVGLLVFSAIGFGLTTATVSWLSWQGYGFPLLGIPIDSDLAATDLGVLVALALGLLLPIIAGIPAIRKQEAARV